MESSPSPFAFTMIYPPEICSRASGSASNIPAPVTVSPPAAFIPSSEAVTVMFPPLISITSPSMPS